MSATISERKIHTIELLTQLEDEKLLGVIEMLLADAQQGDWADSLGEKEHQDIAEGLSDIESGNTESIEAFNGRMKSKFP